MVAWCSLLGRNQQLLDGLIISPRVEEGELRESAVALPFRKPMLFLVFLDFLIRNRLNLLRK